MELWLDAASYELTPIEPHPANRVLLMAGDSIPEWSDSPLFACQDGRILDSSTKSVGIHVDISDSEGQNAARAMIGMVQWIIITTGDWQMIPLENIVASAQSSGTKIVARIDNVQSIRGASFALETGVDALLMPPNKPEIWAEAQAIAAERLAVKSFGEESAFDEAHEAPIVEVEVIAVEDGGTGDRVCVDLTSNLEIGEGLLVGSSANALALIHGETLESEFVPSRPFRINAGAVHAYVLLADMSTKYLCELEAGDQVAICNSEGEYSDAIVGRLKIETRPFLLIRFRHSESGIIGQTFLQQAETVRIVGPNGKCHSVTSINNGDTLLARMGTTARHIGQNVLSAVEER